MAHEPDLKEVEYWGIDDWNRPVFKTTEKYNGEYLYYSCTDILFPYQESEETVKQRVNESHLTYHGYSYDAEPMGTKAKVKIKWRV